MTKLFLIPVVAAGLAFAGPGAESAEARGFGIHVSGPGYHFDIGRSHGHRGHYRGHRGHGHRAHFGHGYHGWGGGHAWHDTTHLDYHPGHLAPHYDHFDYVPGHWDVHHTGHWDHW